MVCLYVCINMFNVQDEAAAEDSKYTISVSVTSPKKVGDGVGAYMVYKVVTKVCHCKLLVFFLPGHCLKSLRLCFFFKSDPDEILTIVLQVNVHRLTESDF